MTTTMPQAQSTQKPLVDWEFQDYGVDHAQYFPGVGVSNTDWTAVYLGVGANAMDAALEALDDLCASRSESIAEFQAIKEIEREVLRFSDKDLRPVIPNCQGIEENEENELYHYVALFVK